MFKEEKKVFNDKIKNYEEEINKLKLELKLVKEFNLELKEEKNKILKLLKNNETK